MDQIKPLQYNEVKLREVDYNELDRLINEAYGLKPRTFNIVADQEWHNDMSDTVTASKGKLDEWETKQIDGLKAGKPKNFILYAVLKDLCNKGLIKPGDYLVNVSW